MNELVSIAKFSKRAYSLHVLFDNSDAHLTPQPELSYSALSIVEETHFLLNICELPVFHAFV